MEHTIIGVEKSLTEEHSENFFLFECKRSLKNNKNPKTVPIRSVFASILDKSNIIG